jgi:hypothetical protein
MCSIGDKPTRRLAGLEALPVEDWQLKRIVRAQSSVEEACVFVERIDALLRDLQPQDEAQESVLRSIEVVGQIAANTTSAVEALGCAVADVLFCFRTVCDECGVRHPVGLDHEAWSNRAGVPVDGVGGGNAGEAVKAKLETEEQGMNVHLADLVGRLGPSSDLDGLV